MAVLSMVTYKILSFTGKAVVNRFKISQLRLKELLMVDLEDKK